MVSCSGGTVSKPRPTHTTPANWWVGADPCSLLSQASTSQAGLFPGTPISDSLLGGNICSWTPTNGVGELELTLKGDAYSTYDTAPPVQGQPSKLTVRGRPARQVAGYQGDGTCAISIQATTQSEAVVTAGINTTAQSCQVALQIAGDVAPGLPS